MADFPSYRMPNPPVITPSHAVSIGLSAPTSRLFNAVSFTWATANSARIFPFAVTDWGIVYQLLFFVGATSSGNIDVGVYDSALNRIVSAGSTAMSASTNAIQEINVADTVLSPGDYFLAGACDNTTGTIFRSQFNDEYFLSSNRTYIQTGLTAAALPATLAPVLDTQANSECPLIGIQLRSVF